MALSLNYTINLQRVDPDNAIRNQADREASISIPDNILGDDTLTLPDGQLDKQMNKLGPVIDFVLLLTDQEITVKFNTVLGTPFIIRKCGSLLVDGKNIDQVFISNTSGSPATVRYIQAVRQQP